MPTAIEELRQAGQSVWLDFIRRGFLRSGGLERYVREGLVSGVTSNPSIFAKAVSGSPDYDDALHEIAQAGKAEPYDAFVQLAVDDIQLAADILRPVYDSTGGADGYVSLEVAPGIEDDTARTVAEATRLYRLVDRPNAMIKVPGTGAGIRALEDLIAAGIQHQRHAAVQRGRVRGGSRVGTWPAWSGAWSRANCSPVSPAPPPFSCRELTPPSRRACPPIPLCAAPSRLPTHGSPTGVFGRSSAGQRWERLAGAGARVQRPLWASTSTKNKAYSDVLYVEALIAPDTVNTMPETTLAAFADHGRVNPGAVEDGIEAAAETLRGVRSAGIDFEAVTDRLLQEGLASFGADFDNLLHCVSDSLAAVPAGRARHSANLGELAPQLEARLQTLEQNDVVGRLWAGDYTLWKPEPGQIPDRLGWLTVVDEMLDQVPLLERFAAEAADDGYDTAVLLGMGGSSLAPEVLQATSGTTAGALRLEVLDTTLPASILALEQRSDPQRTLFIVASKSGTTIEPLSHLAYFFEKIPNSRQFIAITDPGTPLADEARARQFRQLFLNRTDIGGRYSALSHFGLVPAALIGADIRGLLNRALEMLHASHACVPVHDNPGAWLGAVLGAAALAGRDKLTLVLPESIATFGYWVEQLIAESTGKEGTGILPVEGEALGSPDVYGDDRLFVALGDDDAVAPLEAAGHPVVRLPYSEPSQIGGEFFRWEFATAVAGYLLGIDPFDQPNVQEAKEATARILAGGAETPETPALADVLSQIRPGDYIAIQAYLPKTQGTEAELQAVRHALRDRFHVATTIGYGPRFLHSTGQYHKGGRNNGIFIQVVGEDSVDVPIPGQHYTFGELSRAQALGDLQSLQAHDRRVTRVALDELKGL